MLRSGRLSLGPWIDRFEEEVAAAVGRPSRPPCRAARRACTCSAWSPASARRRGDHVAVLVRRLGELRHLRGRRARLRRHRPAHAQPRPGRGRGGDHAAHEGDRRGRHLRLSERVGRIASDREQTRPRADRRLLRGARRALQAAPARRPGPGRGLRVLPEQADHDGRGRRRDDVVGGDVEAAQEPSQPGSGRRRRLARPRPARVQLPDRRHPGRDRDRPAREARPDPGRPRRRSPDATRSCSQTSTGSGCRAPTTPITSARGSSTSSSCRRARTARR